MTILVCQVCRVRTGDGDRQPYCPAHSPLTLKTQYDELQQSYSRTLLIMDGLRREIEGLKQSRRFASPPPPPRTPAGLDKAMMQGLIQLCHPDKHASSELSTKVTQFLMSIRGGLED